MVKGEGFSAQFRFTSLAQGAHLTGSIKLLTRSIRSAICFSSVRRLCTSLLCFLPLVARRRLFSLFSFLSFRVVFLSPSPLPVCLVGLSVGWCVGLLVCRVVGVGSVPFRSVPLFCLLLLAVSALPADPRCRPPAWTGASSRSSGWSCRPFSSMSSWIVGCFGVRSA